MKKTNILFYSLLVLLLQSCLKEEMPSGGQFANAPYFLKLNRTALTLPADEGSTGSIYVSAKNTPWAITGAPYWLRVSPKSGSTDAVVTMNATGNKDFNNTRVAVLQLKSTAEKYEFSKSLTVTQSAAKAYLTTSESSVVLAPQAVQKNVTVNSNAVWEAVCTASWLEVSKTDATTLSLNASENTTAGTRTATITLRAGTTQALATISVVQSEGGITGSTEKVSFEADGGTKSVDIDADVAWSATTPATSWLSITPTSGAGGKVSLGMTALANNSTSARSTYVYVMIGTERKLAIPVSQERISFEVADTLDNFAADGSTRQKLTVESNVAWAVLSCPEWLTVTPSQGNKGTCEITLQATANKSLDSRSATLRIGIEGLTVFKDITLAQEGMDIDLGDRSLEYDWESSQKELEIPFPGSWSAMVSDDWLTLSQSSGLGEETIIVTAAANPGEDARTGTITVASEGRSMKITAVQQGQYLKINSTAGEVGAMGGSVSLTVTTTDGAAAVVEYEGAVRDWVAFKNDDKGNYTLSVAYNPSANNRTAQFIIKPTMSGTNTTCSSGVKFAITQKGRSLSANVRTIAISNAGGTSETYTITADSTYTITKPDADDWYTLQQDSASCTFSITALENTTGEDRRSQITASLTGLPSGETKDLVIEVVQYDMYNGYEYVDLGLPSGIKWATCNVGATKPEEYGGYYAWGETEESENYDWSTYKWCKGSYNTMTKYCTNSSYGTVDNKKVLDPEDDVAHVKWGGNWRMPTKTEQDELRTNCNWTWTTQNGVNGYKVTSKTNGNSIFLPAAGYRYGMYLYNSGSHGLYWSCSLDGGYSYNACYLYFDSGYYAWDNYYRYSGRSVRPVCGEATAPVTKYTVSVSCNGNGSVSINGNSGTSATFEDGSTVTVVATPDEGHVFEYWVNPETGEILSTSAEYTFTVSCDVTLEARFDGDGYTAVEVTDLSQLSDYKLYTLRSERAFLLYHSNTLAASSGTLVNATYNPQDPNQQFRIKKSGSDYFLYSVGAGKFIECTAINNVTLNTATGSNLTITHSGNSAYPWKLGIGDYYLNSQDTGALPTGLKVDGWSITDRGNCYIIAEVGSVNEDLEFGQPNHEYVDLGLPSGIKWATCNVGATTPEEYGGYYAWGETEEKENYDWSTYKWCNGSETTMTKYCASSSYGTVDNKTVLDPEDDVAHVKWGGNWRMPTKAELDELCTNCTWTWTTQNGVKGYKVTSKTNGNSIFLPAAGNRDGANLYDSGSYGYYWSSSLLEGYSYCACYLYFSSGYDVWYYYHSRYHGFSVRPVCSEATDANDSYGISQMDPLSDGAEVAREQRYVETVTTTGAVRDLNYMANGPVADGTQYADARSHVLEVAQGQNVTMTIKAADYSDGLKWCYAGGWLDLNGSGNFDHPLPTARTAAEIAAGLTTVDALGERIFFVGTIRQATPELQNPGVTFTFKVPTDAAPGNSRLRIVFCDAWYVGSFYPTGLTAKGFTIDFGVRITGSNPGRAE